MSMPNHVERQGLVCRYLIVKTVSRTSDPFAMTSPGLAPWPSEIDEQFLFFDTVSPRMLRLLQSQLEVNGGRHAIRRLV